MKMVLKEKLLTEVKKVFKMGIFGKLDKFDKLFKDRLGVNIIHLNYRVTVGNLKDSQQNILKHFGWDDDTLIFGINQTFNDVMCEVVCIGPPVGSKKSKSYCDYLTAKNFKPAWYHYSSVEMAQKKTKATGDKKEWENYDVLMASLDSFYESLQAFFNFLDIYEKQIKVIKDLCSISNDSIEEISQN